MNEFLPIPLSSESPYSGSFDRWDYADYCSGKDQWSMTSTERMEIPMQNR
ncbi:MAG: hypothetical protein WA461_16225 [Nitrososphaeraceae archaeon]